MGGFGRSWLRCMPVKSDAHDQPGRLQNEGQVSAAQKGLSRIIREHFSP